MNKTFLIIFAVVVCVAAASNNVIDADDANEILIEQVLAADELTPEQKKCIEAAVAKARKNNPELGNWLDEATKVAEALQAKAKKCRELGNPLQQRKCLLKVKIEAKKEWIRLVKKLTPEQKKALDLLKKDVEKCLNN